MKKLGVVIGRFQIPWLHEGHKHLINFAQNQSDDLLVLIGTTKAMPSRKNPLDFPTREMIVKKSFPEAIVAALPDHPSDTGWSERIDRFIEQNFPSHEVALFGSRNSFIDYYCGKFPVVKVPGISVPSGTVIRQNISNGKRINRQFLAGLICAQNNRLPISYQTVDVAVIRYEDRNVLMGKKRNDGGKCRFIGGFVDPKDMSLEGAALRELKEEAGPIDCHEMIYLGSIRISDYRYRFEDDKIITAFFLTYKLSGREMAGDDLDELIWVPIDRCQDVVAEEHNPLAKRLVDYFAANKI